MGLSVCKLIHPSCRNFNVSSVCHWMPGHPVMAMAFLLLSYTTSQRIGVLISTFVVVMQLITDRFTEEILIDFQEIIREHSGENLAHVFGRHWSFMA